MKRIYLMRHAKSSWKEPLPDRERPLNKRGEKAAKRMGKYLRSRGEIPQLIVSSDAVRALATAKRLAKALGIPPERIRVEHALYEADARRIVEVIRNLDPALSDVFLVAHNPGISDAAVELSGEERFDWLPTAAVVGLRFDIQEWREVGRLPGRVFLYATPKGIEEE